MYVYFHSDYPRKDDHQHLPFYTIKISYISKYFHYFFSYFTISGAVYITIVLRVE